MLLIVLICLSMLLALSASPLEYAPQPASQESTIQQEFPLISTPVPLPQNSRFATLCPELLARIFSFTPAFPALSSVNRHFLATYQTLRHFLLTERLGGFDPGVNYRLIGSFIQYNYPKMIAFHLVNHCEPDEIALLLKNKMLAKLVPESLAASQDFSTFPLIFPLSPPKFWDRDLVIGFIASNHGRLFPTFLAFIHRNYPVKEKEKEDSLDGIAFLFDYLEQLVILAAPEEDFLDALQQFAQIRPRLFQSTFLDNFCLVFQKHIHSPHQVDLLRKILGLSQQEPPIHLQMPLTILFEPQNWPPYGTWPQIFMQNEVDVYGDVIDYSVIIRTSLDLSIRFNRPTITQDINAHTPTYLKIRI